MGRYLEQYDKDYMRMAILKQEETFRHQVSELHRLYRVQKVLMNDMKAPAENKRRMMNSSNSRTKLERLNCRNTDVDNEILASSPRRQPRYGYSCQGLQRIRPCCRALDLDLPAEEYIGKDDRDVEEEEEEEECGLELTLATGSKSRRRRRKNKENSLTSDSGASFSSSSTESGGTRGKLNGSSEWGGVFHVPDINLGNNDHYDQRDLERNKSSSSTWLFHCSSLNMT